MRHILLCAGLLAPCVAPAPAWATPPGPALSLHHLLAWAREHSPLLLRARARLRGSEGQAEAARALLPANPELELAAGPRWAGSRTGLDLEASLRQELDLGGERGLRIDAAERQRDLRHLELEEALWEVHRQVHAAYHAALVAGERARAADEALRFTQRLAHVASTRLEAGDISPLEARIATAELARARQASVGTASEYLAARYRLAEVSGWPAQPPPEVAGPLDQPRTTGELDALVARARANNPTLRRLGAVLAANRASSRLAERAAWPKPTVGLSYARESEPADGGEAHVGLLSVAVPIPAWQRNQNDRAVARAEVAAARASYDALARALLARVARVRAIVDADAERISAFREEILPAFAANLAALERAFELGEIDILQVLLGRERFVATKNEALAAYDEYFRGVADLETLLGAEIWPDERHDVTEDLP